MTDRLKDKVAIITGAASGQGAAEARLFLQEGAYVVATDVQFDLLKKQANKFAEKFGDRILPIIQDVTKEDDWQKVVDQTMAKFGKIDILVNNAGIGNTDTTSGLEDSTVDDWHHFMDINAMSHFLGMKYVVPYMKQNGKGAIVNVSSLASVQGIAGASPYTASKGASRALTKGAARDLGQFNIRVNAVLPGWIVTPMMQQFTLSKKLLDELIAGIPMGYLGNPEDVGYAVLFLASDEARFVNGTEIVVDGGQSVRG
ncbi:SDR family NAD(P)-dependent oxidoreductase [Limosilactobacillus sp.]|jgi:NAD(P)-dependent dehydrogenase (short-subunit alcohol dehydrogenase family)|uniref:SDR family NAD(P)-dependent oxidoreductase n=1 Tax=Limosilactobacillus sp. TaxID=2773925 RepID=UPI0025BCF80C|nr:SDR family oxidoreductase [Limosilactobacillus sp.]MCH3921274.1 SDR family oxidoreductase [Limosilactobacillus sp.]MCH3928045.1 SDR family oxidoreductase [Limosilactobacillus sp.]